MFINVNNVLASPWKSLSESDLYIIFLILKMIPSSNQWNNFSAYPWCGIQIFQEWGIKDDLRKEKRQRQQGMQTEKYSKKRSFVTGQT